MFYPRYCTLSDSIWIPQWKNASSFEVIYESTQILVPSHDVKSCLGRPSVIAQEFLRGAMTGEYSGWVGLPSNTRHRCSHQMHNMSFSY